ncbi:MAG: nuclease-related domain-containing protein [Patescibacteria group bacterium]|nr:nuclease-related domain-containing protein [Patescibacteria group bacterium]
MFKNDRLKKSPLRKESLRRAGQSLDEKINKEIDDKIIFPFIVVFVIWAIVIISWLSIYFKISYNPQIFTIAAILVTIFFAIKIPAAIKNIKNMRLGRDGECIVAESLEELRSVGYKIYNDIVGESFNIDHIIVGPGGVFTIETKTYRKRVGTNPQVNYDGNVIKIDGAVYPKDAIQQAKGQMYWLEGFIKDKVKLTMNVIPVVIFPGWFITGNNSSREVWVLNENSLLTILKSREQILNKEQINLIASHIESYNRS